MLASEVNWKDVYYVLRRDGKDYIRRRGEWQEVVDDEASAVSVGADNFGDAALGSARDEPKDMVSPGSRPQESGA